MPIKSSRVRDARPQINAEAESEKGLISAEISKGSVNLKRGSGRQPSFAIKYEEVDELTQLLVELSGLLEDNQYTPNGSLEDGYQAGSARHTPTPRAGNATASSEDSAVAGQTPSESGVVSAATQGTGVTPEPENVIVPALAEGGDGSAQAAFDAEPSRTSSDSEEPVQVSQPTQPETNVDNPFGA